MEQECREFLSGYVRIRVYGAECRRFLNLCAFHGFYLWQIRPFAGQNAGRSGEKLRKSIYPVKGEQTEDREITAAEHMPECEAYDACLMAADFKKLRPLVRKSHVRVRILRRAGLPFILRRNRKRLAWPAGILFAVFLTAWLSAHVWSIHIEGNFSLTDDVILEYLEQNGVYCGMWKNQADCQELSQQLRNYFSRLSWTSAELSGTLLTIYVKEGIAEESIIDSAKTGEDGYGSALKSDGDSGESTVDYGGKSSADSGGDAQSVTDFGEQAVQAPTALAAAKSGTVVSIYVRSGLPLVEAGDEVEAGDLLVTGALPVYNDDGEVASWQDVTADADIVLRTELSYYDEVSFQTEKKQYTGREKTCVALRIGDQMFSLPDSFDAFESCDITGVITQARISGQFYLPLYLYRYTAREYETVSYTRPREETEEELRKNLLNFLKNLEEKGVQIFQNDVTIGWYENSAAAAGILTTDESAVYVVAAAHTEEEVTE